MRKIFTPLILALICNAGFGQAGSLDPSFGVNGIVRNNFVLSNTSGNTCRQILLHPDGSFYLVFDMNGQTFVTHRLSNGAVDAAYGENGYSVPVRMTGPSAEMQPDGKIVAGGTVTINGGKDFVVARFNTNGSLDNSFSGDGVQLLDFATRDDAMSSLVLQPDGKIVTAGSTVATTGYTDYALARFNADGSPDNSFSGDARVITELTGNAIVDVGLQNNGRIVGVGVTYSGGSSMTVVCYTPDGNLDNTFGTGGKKSISNCESRAILVQPDNKILVAGFIITQVPIIGRDDNFVVVRLTPDGQMDNSFSGDGMQTSQFYTRDESATCLAIRPNGKILVGGYTTTRPGFSDYRIIQYHPDGSGDFGFTTDFGGGGDYPSALAVQADGKFLAAGVSFTFYASNAYFSVARYNENGILDNTLDGDGKIMDFKPTGMTHYYASALQPDGKLVTAGTDFSDRHFRLVIARYNTDGTLDNSFAGDGSFSTYLSEPDRDDEPVGVAIKPDGKIVVAGIGYYYGRRDFAAIQLNANGTLDNSFSGDGRVLTDVGNEFDIVKCLAVQPDGKILVGGKTEALDLPSRRDQFAIVRYNADGTLDNSFSGDGIVVTGFGESNCHVTALAVQPDGKIIAGGISNPYGNTDFAMARYNADGTLDLTFDSDGLVTTDINIRDWITDIALQSDGKIVASGVSYSAQNWNDFVAARYNPDGSLDNSFSGDGKLVYDAASNTEMATGLALQTNGQIVIGGYITGQYDRDFLLVRFKADGTVDNSFANNGKLIMDFGYGNDQIESLNIWDQRLYAVGGSVYGGEMGTVAAFSIIGCRINVTIPDASTLSNGVLPNTVYIGYAPATDLTLTAQPSDGVTPYSYSWSNGATTSSVTVTPTVATTYTVVVTDAAGCTSSVSKLVNVIDTRCGNKMDKVLICQVPPGNPSNARTVCVDADAVGAHLNTGSYLGGCTSDLTAMDTRSIPLLEETSVRLQIYPNPGIGQFNVMLKTTDMAIGDLVVRDVMGRVVERRKISTNQLVKIGASYPAGVYVVEVMSGNSKWSTRIVKKR